MQPLAIRLIELTAAGVLVAACAAAPSAPPPAPSSAAPTPSSSTAAASSRTQPAPPSQPVATTTPTPEAVGPTARGYAMMADLPGLPGVILLSGATREGPPNTSDMWTFAPATGWDEITPAKLPVLSGYTASLTGDAFAFDTDSDLGVFVDIRGNPWIYDQAANTWSHSQSDGGPWALLGTSMAYDSQCDRMIVFGGMNLATMRENNETWAYDANAGTWERMNPSRSPSSRNFAAMAYDADSDRVILFSGADSPGDTWAYDYDRDAWTEMSPPTAPASRTYSRLVYDPLRDRLILFGGSANEQTAAFGDVWEYDVESNRWANVTQAGGPGIRAWHAMAFDQETGLVVVFGGGRTRNSYTAETWLLDPAAGSWTQFE